MGINIKALYIGSLISSVMVLAFWITFNYIPVPLQPAIEEPFYLYFFHLYFYCLFIAIFTPGLYIASIFMNPGFIIHSRYMWLIFVCSFVFYTVVFFF